MDIFTRLRTLLVLAFVLFVVAIGLASSQQITGLELTIFRNINNWSNDLNWFFLLITQLGSVWVLFAVTLLSIWKKRHRLAVRIFALGASAFLFTEILKRLIARPRPALILADVNVREQLIGAYGFPSGHTAMATVVSLVILPFLPKKWRWLVAVWIILVGLSRIYLGAHAPLDVIGGFAVGAVLVTTSQLVRNKLKIVTKITHLKLTD